MNAPPSRGLLRPANIGIALLLAAAVVLTIAWAVQQLRSEPALGERLDAAAADMRMMAEALARGDLAEAEGLFYRDAHSLTHEIDLDLRARDERVGAEMYDTVLEIERHMFGEGDRDAMQAAAERLAALLSEARRLLAPGG